MKQFIGVIRVSTTSQGESRNGLDSQRAEIVRWAEQNGHTLITIMEEVASGSLPLVERPVMTMALQMARKMKAKVVVSKVDRCSRQADIVHDLMQKKKIVVSVALGEEADEFIQHIYGGLASKERKMIGERTKAGLAAAKARGVVLGNRTNLSEAQEIGREKLRQKADQFAIKLKDQINEFLQAGKNYSQIAERLNSLGVRTARGGDWHCSTISNLVARLRREGCKMA
jgi:DNA invertase Pin-like site-specific DNA recombinase